MNAHLRPILRIVMLTLFGACAFLLPAQEIDIQSNEDKPLEERIVYSHQNTGNIAIHTQGFAVGFKIGKIKTINRTRFWQIEATSIHSPKEIKIVNTNIAGRAYVYGKLNSVYALRVGYGNEKRIFGKPYWGGIETRWTYEAGASLAWLKPYYYYVISFEWNEEIEGYEEVQLEQTFDQRAQWLTIIGRSAFTKGIAESKLSPGVHASVGLSFDFAKRSNAVKSLNVDAIVEGYPLGLSIMDEQRNRWVFVSLMLSYHWGSRFNKH